MKETNLMRELSCPVRWYLWGVALVGSAFTLVQLLALRTLTDPTTLLAPAFLCAVGAFLGERLQLRISRDLWQGLSSTAFVAALLLLPTPVVVALTLAATVGAQALEHNFQVYKRVFNVVHIVLAAGLTSALLVATDAPVAALAPVRLPTNWPLLLALVGVWYTLETGMVVALFSLLDRQPPWRGVVVSLSARRPARVSDRRDRHRRRRLVALLAAAPVLLIVPILGIRARSAPSASRRACRGAAATWHADRGGARRG
jgi:hypothetical protein